MRRWTLLACLAVLPAAAASPVVRPLKDVDITYKATVGGGGNVAILQRLRFSAVLHRQRVDMPTSGNWMTIDFITRKMALVRDETREVVDMTAPETATLPNGGNASVLVGPGNVAGLACTEWRSRDLRGQETINCYTDDGVLLRVRAGTQVVLEAVNVTYAAQDAAIFQPPPGFTHQQRE